jgi:hypothetical protein
MEEKFHIATILKTRQYMFFINSYIVLGTILTVFFAWYFHVRSIIWIGSIIFLLLPIVAKRYFMTQFSECKTFLFKKDSMFVSSKVKRKDSDDIDEIELKNIRSYKYEEGYGNPYLIL